MGAGAQAHLAKRAILQVSALCCMLELVERKALLERLYDCCIPDSRPGRFPGFQHRR
jgi:hypothetical protein